MYFNYDIINKLLEKRAPAEKQVLFFLLNIPAKYTASIGLDIK